MENRYRENNAMISMINFASVRAVSGIAARPAFPEETAIFRLTAELRQGYKPQIVESWV
jgi:hypothetical protein